MKRRTFTLAAIAASAVALAGCGSFSSSEKTKPRVRCSNVLLERSTADLVAFRPGPGRDLTDVMYEAQFTGYTGDCSVARDGSSITLTVQPTFAVTRGPAWPGGTQQISYFVAIPAFYPAPEAKKIYSVPFSFPEGTATSVVLRDEKVTLQVPVPEGGTQAPPVYLGFQLTPDQLEYNREVAR